MKLSHFNKLCKKLEEWEIIEQSLGMIRLTRKFKKLMIKNALSIDRYKED